jgi:type VI secretion system protein ImpM
MAGPAGLYGKLPAKRDFVSRGLGRDLLGGLEPWLQAAVADSRDAFGTAWRDHFLAAPIWRFLIGPDVAGVAALGAITPSVDGVGRYFPLLVAATAAPGASFAAPDDPANEPYFAVVEAILLAALDGVPFEETAAAVAALAPPPQVAGGPRGPPQRPAGGPGIASASAHFDGLPPATFMRTMIRPAPLEAPAPAGAPLP